MSEKTNTVVLVMAIVMCAGSIWVSFERVKSNRELAGKVDMLRQTIERLNKDK